MSAQLTSSLSSLLPTLSPLPGPLLELATSLVAQSRARASSLKPEEEIARTYACCHIACERLGKKLGLEIGRPAPPCQPRVYGKLKGYLGSVLRTPGGTGRTPRGRGGKDGVMRGGVGSGRKGGVDEQAFNGGRNSRETPSKRTLPAVDDTPSKRVAKAAVAPKQTQMTVETDAAPAEAPAEPDGGEGNSEQEEEDGGEPTPVKRPARTPLRRKEKHAKRDSGLEEDMGAAGLLPGLGTMFQPAVDWLSDERRAEYKVWEKIVYRGMAAIQRQGT